MKLLSIIIPTYNMEKYLDRCLSSLVVDDKDLLDTLDVLIINDGSRDKSTQIGQHYQTSYPNTFRLIDKENGNYGSCINRGLSEAQGLFMKVLDADDYFDTRNLVKLLNLLTETTADCIISDMNKVLEDGKITDCISFNLPTNKNFAIQDLGEAAWNMWMHCVCYRTENLRRINYHQTEGISYTDQELICLPMSTVTEIAYLPHVVYNYLVGRKGQTVDLEVWEQNFYQEIEGVKAMMVEEKNLYPECSEAGHQYINLRIARRVYNIYNAYFTKFKSFINNDLMVEFDQYLKQYSTTLYNAQDEDKVLKVFHYVTHWRKNYTPDTLYLNTIRILSNLVHKLKYEYK